MLPKKQRIPQAAARDVFMLGQSLSSPHFFLKTLKTEGESRFAVSISKKVAHTAVLRNRTRRRTYAALRPMVPNIKSGLLIGFSVKKGGESLSMNAIATEIQALLARAHLLK